MASLGRTFRLLRLLPAELQTSHVKPAVAFRVSSSTRNFSTEELPDGTFKASDVEVTLTAPHKLQAKPDVGNLIFGRTFTDHMFTVEWDKQAQWGKPQIKPMGNLPIHPAAKVLHYAIELFEGMKAYRGVDGRIRLFRPDLNMQRILRGAKRAMLPTFDPNEFIGCIKKLVKIEQEWIPHSETSSLYIRPTYIGTDPSLGVALSNNAMLYIILCPVGPYFATGFKPVSLYADPKYVRAWPGGCGDQKLGSNYGPTVFVQKTAEARGQQQVLWLYGEDHQLTEVGTMNIFFVVRNANGEKELITPPLNGLILPGVTRFSVLDLCREWKELKITERTITMAEVQQLTKENRLLEMFGAGTACIVCPVCSISYLGEKIDIPTAEQENPVYMKVLNTLSNIFYGKINHPWGVLVD
ncbi:Branched-chain-amino-acid aminotransferase, cytosolic [Orchesella cincta]|uniref:Branched-chain-amino-acid aminotransferase n=1 Tax=Orchesella cincta TaxID=48709 RepID=A0A1D2MZF8_ORCCI|nr:Branched-chain-amino-acid aminotransferase, cytosolic [Orchesella cincta]